MNRSKRPRRTDRRTLADLDLIDELVTVLRSKFPQAIEAAESVSLGTSGDGLPIRTSGVSDPTARVALDGRRQRRIEHVNKSRKEIAHATKSLRRAVVHAGLAGEG